MTKYCPNCGEELIDDANFCKKCGASMTGGVSAAQAPERPLAEKSYTIIIIIGYIAAILIPIIGILIGIYLYTRKDSPDSKHGLYIIIVAIVVWVLSFAGMMLY